MTQWIPDAIGGADVMRLIHHRSLDALESHAKWSADELVVATRDGPRRVPEVDIVTRAHVHCTVDRSIRLAERSLADEVFGYRDATTAYSGDWTRFLAAVDELARGSRFVVEADIKSCFESVSLDALRAGGWASPSLLELLKRVHAVTGWVLIPGHRWARRLANVVLGHLDAAIHVPFCRWQDDYRIGCRSRVEADDVLRELAQAARSLNLSLNATKVRIAPAKDVRSSIRHQKQDPSVDELLESYHESLKDQDLSGLKFSLARLVGRAHPPVTNTLELAIREMPALAPRAAVYLDSVVDQPGVSSLISGLVHSEDPWLIGRFLPVVVRNPMLSGSIDRSLVELLLSHQADGIRALAGRVALRRDIAVPLVPERIAKWAAARRPWDDPPPLATRL